MTSGSGRFAESFKAVIFQPEDVEANLVALDQIFIAKNVKAVRLFASMTIRRVVARPEHGTLALMASGLVGLTALVRRRLSA
jgi:hypothetical protein